MTPDPNMSEADDSPAVILAERDKLVAQRDHGPKMGTETVGPGAVRHHVFFGESTLRQVDQLRSQIRLRRGKHSLLNVRERETAPGFGQRRLRQAEAR